MKELKGPEQIETYLVSHQIQSLFSEEILPYLTIFEFDKGEQICSQGEAVEYLYILVKGKVKIFTTSEEGKTLILSFKTPLEVIGDIEYVQEIDTINTVEAVSPVIMIGVRQTVLRRLLKDHSPFLQFLLKIITRKFYIKSQFMRHNILYPVETRLASYLVSVAYDENEALVNGRVSTSNLTDIANLIGTSYRHLNRVIKEFSLTGLVERDNGAIVIKDLEGLKSLAKENLYE
ncbi:Crp/Fnr family transcriptional regulator [Mesobacillus selenatarsenatis]|uniref:Predicted N-ribosylnicotinamide CRP-like regulator n=1 Tax=Mesobacillus selenatarsenatis (strain DSM 18680 / JCM 14380 / FERM P-15431 / SF-1) TaxID=1321606 RepID=A0A0A8WXF7_MESS1|nr:cyclic nucleotide-binding domain-containing protein [Mesobacillus selenatarsenatis]GAM12350.1 predicted N-ribosylnicotinamide CRP-like regulator [Mesobacillus selenatarsenatis SF-1]